MIPLSQYQLTLLRSVAQSATGIDPPDASGKTVNSLIKRGLIVSTACEDGPNRLTITQDGQAALSGSVSDHGGSAQVVSATSQSALERQPREGVPALPPRAPTGKIGALVALLRQPDGSDLDAMMQATGWQAHSVRGALSGSIKKALGLNVVSQKTTAGRRYRILDGAGA